VVCNDFRFFLKKTCFSSDREVSHGRDEGVVGVPRRSAQADVGWLFDTPSTQARPGDRRDFAPRLAEVSAG
jgi:hypothetical protein